MVLWIRIISVNLTDYSTAHPLKDMIAQRNADILTHFLDKILWWDVINDYNVDRAKYHEIFTCLKDKGVEIQAFLIFKATCTAPGGVWNKPCRCVRISLNMVGPCILQSCPSSAAIQPMRSISWWDMADGQWLKAPSELVKEDLTLKPAIERLVQLIKRDWWTNTSEHSNEAGVFRTKGFCGRYLVKAEAEGRTVSVEVDLFRDRQVYRDLEVVLNV